MKAIEIRNKYLEFFKRHGHAVIPSAPLIPENDPSVLFTTVGMQPLVQYLLGKESYIIMLQRWYVRLLLHGILIINTYFLIKGEKYYNENVGAE